MLLVGIYQTSLFGEVKPGIYDVTIKANSTESIRDTWVFSKNGTFKSKGLGDNVQDIVHKNNGHDIVQ